MKKNNELSIKSKLLFNNLDMNFKIVTSLETVEDKRIKALDKIFSIYRMTCKPFIADESMEYRNSVEKGITNKYNSIVTMINRKQTIEGILFVLNPVLESLKNMVTTCKLSLDVFNLLWNIDNKSI